MAFDVRIEFVGICVPVRRQMKGDNEAESEWTSLVVLLPDLAKPKTVGGVKVGTHRAVLVRPDGAGPCREHDLSGKEISFAFTLADGAALTTVRCPKRPLGRSFDEWVIQMADIDPQFARVTPALLASGRTEKILATRIVSPAGLLIAADLENAESVLFPDSPVPERVRTPRLIASRYALCFEGVKTFSVKERPLGSNDAATTLYDVPTKTQVSATLYVANVCDADVIELSSPWRWQPRVASGAGPNDPDFAAAYLLSSHGPTKKAVVPVVRGAGGGSGPKCRTPAMAE